MWMGQWWFDRLRNDWRGEIELSTFDLPLHGERYTGSLKSVWIRGIRLGRYVDSLCEHLRQYPRPPVLIGHSLGCLLIEAALARLPVPPPGIVLIAPTRHKVFCHSVCDFAHRHPFRFLWLNLSLSMWPPVATVPLARELLFPLDMPDAEVGKFHEKIHGDSYVAAVQLLLKWGPKPARVPGMPVLVIGGRKDKAVRMADVRRVARFHQTRAKWFDLPHNMLLSPGWEEVADCIKGWVRGVGQPPAQSSGHSTPAPS